jgi:hypothetical protein
MKLQADKKKIDCRGCATGCVTAADYARGKFFCSTCYENFLRLTRGELLLDANPKVMR